MFICVKKLLFSNFFNSLICLQFAIFYLLNKAWIEIRLIRSKSRIFELTSDDLEYDLNRPVWSRRVQRCIIYASTTSGTYSSTFGIVQPRNTYPVLRRVYEIAINHKQLDLKIWQKVAKLRINFFQIELWIRRWRRSAFNNDLLIKTLLTMLTIT